MANTTFNGPVRSEGGFEQITKSSTTGAVTTNFDVDTSGNLTTTGYVSAYSNVSSITDATKSVESTESGLPDSYRDVQSFLRLLLVPWVQEGGHG